MILSILLVLASGFTHAVWSLFAKRSGNKAVFLWSIMILTTIILFPQFIIEMLSVRLSLPAWGLLALSALLQAAYALMLTFAYRMGDLSQVYPIMRGTSTLQIPLVGVLLLHESLTLFGWLGLCCMIFGFLLLSGIFLHRGASQAVFGELKPFLMAFCIGLCTTCYVFVDKLNLQHISTWSLLEVTNIGFVAGLTPLVLTSGHLRAEWNLNKKTILLGTVLNPGSYLLFLFAMKEAPVALIAPLRECGTVFATLLGIYVLNEGHGRLRICCSILIAMGIVLIGLLG
ncbi:EamA family transporter [Paenibacillus filicis]|uniref:EamA family transporter n=1 Tax=Paenibacillus gyeongsangnamensis TaxID=3388067 RepID=A0ABT4QJ35_9BACL|nr:EamA family transporter [Paenibacillus filicis]MCZ8516868.1 EamA family transporter [Paenibacillus filicis]